MYFCSYFNSFDQNGCFIDAINGFNMNIIIIIIYYLHGEFKASAWVLRYLKG